MRKGRVASVVSILGKIFLAVGIVTMIFSVIIGAGLAGIIPTGIFVLAGIIMIIITELMNRKRRRLIEHGVQAEAVITRVARDLAVRVNNSHPFRAECRVTDSVTGEVYLYSSPRIIQDITHLQGRTVTVYYDPDNRKKYFVDIEALISESEENDPAVHDYR
ncbi:MAG: DUF3592 domain-containing protein [Ruminiclostridium sp.]|nr:DUF3592 domain-containing protein [Ruminiclostridium sp.]